MRKLGVVIFGAGTYDHHSNLDNPRFSNSAQAFKKLVANPQVLAGFETEALDLYDQKISLGDTVDKIIDFVSKEHDDIIVYYCGHGDVGMRDGDYRVFLRQSNRERRHSLLEVVVLINDINRLAQKKRVYFILDACYSGAAVNEMEMMDAGGAEALIERQIKEAVIDCGIGTAVLTASGRFGVALAKLEDELTLFTGALTGCLSNGMVHRTNAATLSWLDLKDEIVRVTRERLGPRTPIARLTSVRESASDITREPFFANRAFVPEVKAPIAPFVLDERASEQLYWRHVPENSPPDVLEDFLTKFPAGMFAVLARTRLVEQIKGLDERDLEAYLLDHPRSVALKQVNQQLARLKWARLSDSRDVAELRQFAARFPESEFKQEALRRIDLVSVEEPPVRTFGLAGLPATPTISGLPNLPARDPPPIVDKSPDPSPRRADEPAKAVDRRKAGVMFVLAIVALIAGVLVYLAIPTPRGQLGDPDKSSDRMATSETPTPPDNASVAPPVLKPPPPPPSPPTTFVTYQNYDIDQNDLNFIKNTSRDSCAFQCKSDAQCVGYAFDKWNNACYLKKSIGPLVLDPRSDMVIRTDQSPPSFSGVPKNTCLYRDSSIAGNVARSLATPNVGACRSECERDQNCIAYTFLKASNRCSILSSTSGRTKNDPTSESGTRMQNTC